MEGSKSMRAVSEEYALEKRKDFLFGELVNRAVVDADRATWLLYGSEDIGVRVFWLESFWVMRASYFQTLDLSTIDDLTEAKAELSRLLTINNVLIFLTDQLPLLKLASVGPEIV